MLSESQVDQLAEKAIHLCAEIGIGVENDEVTKCCLEKGCQQGDDQAGSEYSLWTR